MTTVIGLLLLAVLLVPVPARVTHAVLRRPALARLVGPAAAVRAAEGRLTRQILTGRLDRAAYRNGMTALAHNAPATPGPRRTRGADDG